MHGHIVTAMTGNQFQTAFFTGTGLDWLIDAVFLDGIEQLPVIIRFPVDGEWVIQKLKEIGRVQTHGKAFALTGDGQAF